jgi:probable DNA repair protein
MPSQELAKQDLFSRLAEGHAAGITVVTPNRRLAQVLKGEFDSLQTKKSLAAWEDADILPLESFAQRCYEEALYAEGGDELPTLLSPAQSRALWEEAVRGSRWNGALLDVPQTAASAQDAWRLAQAWNIAAALEKFPGNEDTQAFAAWAREYAQRCGKKGFIDLPLLLNYPFKNNSSKNKTEKPQMLVAYAFDILPPQTKGFFDRFELLICNPARKQSRAVKTSFPSPREELASAARWARARLEAAIARGKPARIGVVVPDLELRRREAARVFARVMGSPRPFELSIGEPLSSHAIVDFALSLLEFSFHEIKFEQASRLIRSPFLGGADREMAQRARFDARLRRKARAEISLAKLIGLIEGCPVLRRRLEKIFELKTAKQSPHDWAQHYSTLLKAAGFPGDRAPDPAEYQAHAKFNEVLGEFSRLSLTVSNISSQEALRQLRRLCAEILFQPEGVGGIGAPVQVLGLIESVGIEFDALWVSGLTDGAWPQRARPDPFLPVALQRKAGVPAASAEASLALDRRRTDGWLGAAHEVVFSWARREADRELSPSPLIAQLPDGNVDLPLFASYRELIFKKGKMETFTDEKSLSLENRTVRGGTRVLADQAACPFRAFARHRLGAEALAAPEPGLDAMQRGQLLHALMAGIWSELKASSALCGDLKASIEKSAENAVKEQGVEGRFAELEKQRLIRLAGEWLTLERARPPFEVIQIEQKKPIEIGGLSFNGRIDRMDRLLEGEMRGTHAIIDYKTGSRATPNDWLGERPDEPQLPLYAVTAQEQVSAVAFARLKPGGMKFAGFSMNGKEIPGVKQAKSWSGLMLDWRAELENLAAGFAAGDARVDPKKALATCRNCDLQPLCRVHERLSALDSALEQPAAAEDDS